MRDFDFSKAETGVGVEDVIRDEAMSAVADDVDFMAFTYHSLRAQEVPRIASTLLTVVYMHTRMMLANALVVEED